MSTVVADVTDANNPHPDVKRNRYQSEPISRCLQREPEAGVLENDLLVAYLAALSGWRS